MVQPENRITWQELWVKFTKLIGQKSTCVRRQIGVVIVSSDLKQIINYGFNGNVAGGPNTCDRPLESGNCGCIHAEENALIKPRNKNQDLVMFTTVVPCIVCAKLIINAGDIKTIYFSVDYHDTLGLDLLIKHGIIVKKC